MVLPSRAIAARVQQGLARHLISDPNVLAVRRVALEGGQYHLIQVEAREAPDSLLKKIPASVDGIPIIVIDLSLLGRELDDSGPVKECPCKVTMRVMASLGAKKTARMHLQPNNEWSDQDWEDHLTEEDDVLIPILRARGHQREADRIATEHVVMRRFRQQHGKWPMDALMQHAAYEDWVVANLLGDLDPLKKAETSHGRR